MIVARSWNRGCQWSSDRAKREEYDQSVNHRIILDAEAEAYELWRSLFQLNGVPLPA